MEVNLTSGKDDRRRFDATAGANGTYIAKIVPLPPQLTPTTMPVVITYPAGSIRSAVEDQQIRLDDRPMRLGQLSRIERREGKVIVVGRSGKEISGTRLTIGGAQGGFRRVHHRD